MKAMQKKFKNRAKNQPYEIIKKNRYNKKKIKKKGM